MKEGLHISTKARKLRPIPLCPTAGDGVHAWLMSAAWVCRFNGMTPGQAADELSGMMTRRPSPPREVEQAVAKVFDYAEPAHRATYRRFVAPVFKPERLTAIARRMDGFSIVDLTARSPLRPDTRTPASFLHALYRPGEQILLFSKFQSQGQIVATRTPDLEPYNARVLDKIIKPAEGKGTWFLCNPIDGGWRTLDRLKTEHNPMGRTRRSEECLTSFRFLVIESDKADPVLWLAALAQMPLPIVAVYSSGGKSIHALTRIDATDGEHWREIKSRLAPALITLGADNAAMTAVRLTRLPQCFRAETGRWQELHYLNPAADETPIAQLPTR